VPASGYVYLADAAGCSNYTNPPTVVGSSTNYISVNMIGKDTACFNSPTTLTAVVSGGCPPYTYYWTPNNSNTNTNTIVLTDSSTYVEVVVYDKDGNYYAASKTLYIDTPRLGAVSPANLICNRGSVLINAVTLTTLDSVLWYDDPNTNAYSFIYRGKPYTTPNLNATKTFYASAMRSRSDLIGRVSTAGATVGSTIQTNVGLTFTVIEPIVILRCSLYIAGPSSATINIALLDKYGAIISQTGDFSPSFNPGGATLPTVVSLNFLVQTPDVGYKLAIIGQSGITTFNRNTGIGYPISTTKPMIITGSYSQANPGSTDYFYFYNILIQKNICIGPKKAATAIVTEPIVPKLPLDMVYTQVCRNSPSQLFFNCDTFGNRFVWFKDGIIWKDIVAGVPQDTSLQKSRTIASTQYIDTGYYQVKIYSTKYCTRDTFTREVKLAIYPEAKLTEQPPAKLDVCAYYGNSIAIKANNTLNYTLLKYNPTFSVVQTNTSNVITFNSNTINDTSLYQVYVQDANNCPYDTSIRFTVITRDTPRVTMQPIDSILCNGDLYTIKAKVANATSYQWYKDNGILPFFIRDSITFFSLLNSDSGVYNLHATSYPGCPTVVTNYGRITVIPSPKILGFYPPVKICEGNKLRLTASALSYSGLQWYKNTNTPIGFNADTFVINAITPADADKYYFKALSSNKCPSKTSDTINVSVVKKAIVTSSLTNQGPVCAGMPFSASFSTTNGKIYQWYRNGAALQSSTDSNLKILYTSILDTGVYYLRVTSDAICPETISNSFKLSVQPAPAILLHPIGDTLCKGSNITMYTSAINSSGYDWQKDGTLLNAKDSFFKITNLSTVNDGKYKVIVYGISPCPSITTNSTDVKTLSGASKAIVSLVSNYNAIEQCTDEEDWTYYSTAANPDEFIFAVRKNGSKFRGKVDVFLRPSLYDTKIVDYQSTTGTIMLNRYWNLKIDTGTITNPVDVKFYYKQSETSDLEQKKLFYETTNKKDTSFKFENSEIKWIKSDSIPFSNTLINDSIKGNVIGFKHKVLTDVTLGIENSLNYIIFNGITNIGGGSGLYTYKAGKRIISGINENEPLSSSIYPNPNDGQFSLELYSRDFGLMEMTIYNTLSQKVYEQHYQIVKNRVTIPVQLPNLANGIYQMVLKKGNVHSTLKFQIEK
jgi:hypothetical protein